MNLDNEGGAAIIPQRIASALNMGKGANAGGGENPPTVGDSAAAAAAAERKAKMEAERQSRLAAAKADRERQKSLPESKCAKWRAGILGSCKLNSNHDTDCGLRGC